MSTTYVVELTPVGRGAVSVVMVAGPDAIRAVDDRLAPAGKQSIAKASIGRILFGRWNCGEEVVVCRRADDRVEVHCHGGVAAVRAVVEELQAEGCRSISWQDWLRIDSTDVGDAITREAQIALADTATSRTAAILLDQLNGALSAAIRAALSTIATADWSRAAELLDELLARRDVGLHLTIPWRVVLAGPPNVGKSSLINALAGYERVIVSPLPGTTRDVVSCSTAIDGWPVELSDTAGLRASNDELEAAGVELAQAALERADLAILVRDGSAPNADAERWQSAPPRTIHVLNKIDLLPKTGVQDDPARYPYLPASALTGEGIAELAAAIGSALVPNPPARGAAMPFTPRQFESLAAARNAIERRHASAANEALQSMLAEKQGSGFRVKD